MSKNTRSLLDMCGHPANREVIAYLENQRPSAHSDIVSELLDAAAHLPDRQFFCPDPAGYAYVALHLPNGVVYALAIGMDTLIFRLPEIPRPPETSETLRVFQEISGDWRAVEMFRGGDISHDREMARRLCASAHRQAARL